MKEACSGGISPTALRAGTSVAGLTRAANGKRNVVTPGVLHIRARTALVKQLDDAIRELSKSTSIKATCQKLKTSGEERGVNTSGLEHSMGNLMKRSDEIKKAPIKVKQESELCSKADMESFSELTTSVLQNFSSLLEDYTDAKASMEASSS